MDTQDEANVLREAARRIENLVINVLPRIRDVNRARESAVRYLALSMPRRRTQTDLDYLSTVFQQALPDEMWSRDIAATWANSLPAPARFDINEPRGQVRDFARSIADITEIHQIADRMEVFAATIAYEQEMQTNLLFVLRWGTMESPVRLQIDTLFLAYCTQIPVREAFLPPDLWDRIRQVRPNLTFREEQYTDDDEEEEDEEEDEEEGGPQSRLISRWFEQQLAFKPENSWLSNPPHPGPEVEDFSLVNEMIDLRSVAMVLREISHRMVVLLLEERPSPSLNAAERDKTLQLLHHNNDELNRVFEDVIGDGVNSEDLRSMGESDIHQCIQKAEKTLGQARERIAQAEGYLVSLELMRLNTDDAFRAHASRFERAKGRVFFKQIIDGLKMERLKQVDYTSDVLRPGFLPAELLKIHSRARRQGAENSCSICMEDFTAEEGEVENVPVVTPCCTRLLHLDCLLSWVFLKITMAQPMSCPWCRADVDLIFLGEMMEIKIREFGNL